MELTFFYKPGCPYCRRAEALLTELVRENPAYGSVAIERVDENANALRARQYDYWYVPCFFLGHKKLYEADPAESAAEMKAALIRVLDAALA